MTALSDLQAAAASIAAADTSIKAAVQAAITLIGNLQTGSVAASDVEAVVTQLNAASADFSQAATNLGAAASPPPPPGP